MDNVALVFLARDTLDGGAAGYGVAASAYGVGTIVAPLLLLRRNGRGGSLPALVLLIGLSIQGTGTLLTGLSPVLAFAVAAQGLAGSGSGLENVATDTLIQKSVPRRFLGRVFGNVYGPIFLAESLAYVVGGPLLDLTSPRAVFVVAGSGTLAVTLLVWRLLPRSESPGPRAPR